MDGFHKPVEPLLELKAILKMQLMLVTFSMSIMYANDFIKNSVEFIINDSSDFDFGGDEEEPEEEEPQVKVTLVEKEEPKPIPVISHGKILDDFGNVIGTF